MIKLRPLTQDDLTIFKKWLYTPHVAKWYHEPQDWIMEVEQQDGEFNWIHHFIVEYDDKPIGFCQYYACDDSVEEWEGYTALGGSYSIDYMIGEPDYLGKGLAKQIVFALIDMIKEHSDAKRIVVKPEEDNDASRGLLQACKFELDKEKDVYVWNL